MRVLLIHGLGICEHCGSLFTAWDIKGADWSCPACGRRITNTSFGYKQGENIKKVKWVGKEGRWITEKPQTNFDLVINSERCQVITKLDKTFGPRNQMSCFRR
jgi:hypothetical protein